MLQWIADFSERIKQLRGVSQIANDSPNSAAPLKGVHVWLGRLFTADDYIVATGQYVAQANQWSLEKLTLSVSTHRFILKVSRELGWFALMQKKTIQGQNVELKVKFKNKELQQCEKL